MNAKQLWAKIKLYPLALSLLGVAIVLAGWAFYRGGSLDDARQAYVDVTSENDRVTKNVTDGKNFELQSAELADDIKKFKSALIVPDLDIPNQKYFYDFEQTTKVHFVDVARMSISRDKDPAVPSITTFTLSATGSWETMASFLYALQTGPHLLRINQFRLEKTKQTNGGEAELLSLALNVEVLGQ